MSETHENRLKRMRMRSWRRGMKEMDLIFGPWADRHLGDLDAADLDRYDEMLAENDQEIFTWFTGAGQSPAHYEALVMRIGAFARSHVAGPLRG